MGFKPRPTKIFQDSVCCTNWANSDSAKHISKHKHINIKHNFVKPMVERKQIVLVTVWTTEMKADFLMKALLPSELTRAIIAEKIFS